MKVLHLPFTYYPDPPGGTEVYVSGLVRHLDNLGVEGVVAAPSARDASEQYDMPGHRVHRFPVLPPRDLSEIYGRGSAEAADAIRRIVELERPDIVHMHAYTRALSLQVARSVRRAGLPLVITYHTPTMSCQRGTLLRYGRIPCDGMIRVSRCSACIAQQNGAGWLKWVLAMLPPHIGSIIRLLGLSGRWWAALRLTELLSIRKRAFNELVAHASAVVAVSAWVRELLRRNDVPPELIILSRQGTDVEPVSRRDTVRATGAPVRAAMLGRLDTAKGLGILLDALALAPTLAIEVDVYGVVQDPQDAAAASLLSRMSVDTRVRSLPPFEPSEAAAVIADYDVTLVPSQVLETGPLVVLESFAAGVPVVGSRLGGISERVRHEVDGLLVEPGSPEAWCRALTRIVVDEAVLPTLARGIAPPKTMRQVAGEMRDLYMRLLASRLEGTSISEPPATA